MREVDVGGVSQAVAVGDASMSDKESSSNKGMLVRAHQSFQRSGIDKNVIPHSSSDRPEASEA